MTNTTGYVCHECGNGLEAINGSRMFYCDRCKARRRTPTHPALMAPWRWEQTLQERRSARARFATP